MTPSFRSLRHIAVASSLLFGIASQHATAADSGKITIMVGGITKLIYLPARLTEQLGYFKDEGLDVELLSQPAGVDAENELLAGAVQAVVGFYDHTIDLQTKGKDVKAIVVFGQVPGEVEMVSTKAADTVKSMADVKGKTLGVTGLGSSTSFLTQYLAGQHGIQSTEYTMLPVGADVSFIAAIKQGRIDAGMTTEPTVSALQKSGDAKVLVDMRSVEGTKAALGGTYPASSLYVQAAWADSHKAEAAKLAHAFVRTMQFIHTHSAEEIAAKMPDDYQKDKPLYVSALKASLPMYTPDGKMPADGPATVLKVLSAFNPSVKGKHIELGKTYTNEFVGAK
ncbi:MULTISPECIES: ABC transporter substrate-binding protein [Paraburkholderia]|jgi:NitT/TauT family transport system substrate-binding protein|uniref:NitT/TauT family transport system substrate-binding protein n=1 Tax=Paraburkholderia fungorum TaxID=134537 RepID=A0AAW3V2F2_9BURK|nr:MULTISPECIES: ABC transporter substrate-binding protein [Paraburkholderia]KFX64492.1 nitrate ABC transporter substrate-binding protein [Burkholderia sp. K24]MBB4519634.1 NitT/TauT family transport system substrate-binding protein [Paraburkholderia fungorum]MBB6203530.1 NitT/TauT family transport system substrate-binding protein [Paraburkholderia fungorum]USX07302.1 ABC transporter substrate-binding protein [Paraburkholderia fungorum]